MRGIDLFLEMLADFGVRQLFGNPGTSELPLMDALVSFDRIQYILGLHETAVMGMADGYAQASGKLAVINLHVSCGVGNAMGQLYNAFRENTPLLVTAGQQDRRLMFEEPILWGDLIGVVRPWTKMAVEVQRIADLPRALQRAVQAALTPPTGPVFLSLPMDLQSELTAIEQVPRLQVPANRWRPDPTTIAQAAKLLSQAERPVILAGSRIVQRDAVGQLVSFAETCGADVFTEPLSHQGRLPFPCQHPLARNCLPMWAPEMRQALAGYDAIVAVGMDLLKQYVYHDADGALPANVPIVQIDEDSRELNKNYPTAVAIWSDCGTALAELTVEVDRLRTDMQRQAAIARRTARDAAAQLERTTLAEQLDSIDNRVPVPAGKLMRIISQHLPSRTAIVETAVTTTQSILQRLGAVPTTDGYFAHRGWSLGWGLNAAIGVRLAWPDRPVLGILGDGAALYGIQGLWTAAHYKIPVTWIVCNNREYRILKQGAASLGLPNAQKHQFESLTLDTPPIDFVTLAQSFGIEAQRPQTHAAIVDCLSQLETRDTPLLIEVPVE
ncbi:MAG: thiamine pyrophosphate-binding protein [Planctomycetales bacterium]|nr:thiamine pyrophosphate-binding protein [Planctomycetales bacterium]